MRRPTRSSLALLLIAGGIPAAALTGTALASGTCAAPAPAKLGFTKPVYVDQTRAGGEPVSQVAQDGSITVSAHAGTTHAYKDPSALPGAQDFVRGYSNQVLNWRSTDHGKSWKFIGLAGQSEGPHSATTTGFSDPDLTMDAGGKLYNTEIDLANVSVFASPDDGQSWPVGTPIADSGDRPWLTGADKDVVYLYVNTGNQLWKSTDGAVSFLPVTTNFPATGKLIVDPKNPHHGLIGPSDNGIAMSADDGKTWKTYNVALGKQTQFFGAVAVDKAGNVYKVSAGGYDGSGDIKPDGEVKFAAFDRKTMTWNAPVNIKIPSGDAMWPWIIAGDKGRVGVAWYQRMGKAESFRVYAAYTVNGLGSDVKCGGKTKHVGPTFSVVDASKRAIHTGPICLQGTNCNLATNFQRGDRRLGDFFTINTDLSGHLIIAASDTMLRSATEGPKLVSNPIFMSQTSGFSLFAKPIKPRKTRCLFPLPSC
ncbi:MAG: hypothetical protein QOJ92_2782 [Frankiales bacterium]|nr:hypothetical protein [Frankiales bacterium]